MTRMEKLIKTLFRYPLLSDSITTEYILNEFKNENNLFVKGILKSHPCIEN